MIVIADRRAQASSVSFADGVREGLSRPDQKELPSKYLYDPVGSALFDAICELPEYGLARAGLRIIRRHAEQIVSRVPSPALVAELGSGSARATRWILEALSRRQPVTYYPIDISRAALVQAERELAEIPSLGIVGFEREYLEGLDEVAARRQPGQTLLVLFLGGTIGNFDRDAGDDFLRQVRKRMRADDRLLLSTDLVKPEAQLVLAYDDPAGVTAAFDKNLLARINRELGGDFDLRRFQHLARWNRVERRIEMHLRSTRDQRVRVEAADLDVRFHGGETIWTESSHKYDASEVADIGLRTGFRGEAQWIDVEWPFAQNLLVAV